jgi:SAM-dependent methyltransferase
MDIDAPDSTFDFAYASLVFQHLPDPLGAMREVRRVLRPGGKLVIFDIDDGLNLLIEPASPEADAINARMQTHQASRGGSRFIGRRLWRLMAEAGFTGMDLEMTAIHSDEMGVDALIPDEWDQGFWDAMLQSGVVTSDDVEVMRREHVRMHASPDKYVLFLTWMVCGSRGA